MGFGEHNETFHKMRKVPGLAEGLPTMQSNNVLSRTPIAPKIQSLTLWRIIGGRAVKPHAFQTLELNEGDWSNRQFGHIRQTKSALYSLTETGDSQIWIKLPSKE